jgi:hypothetical protein
MDGEGEPAAWAGVTAAGSGEGVTVGVISAKISVCVFLAAEKQVASMVPSNRPRKT